MNETVENMEQGNVLDDAALNPVQEEATPLEALESLISEPAEQPEPAETAAPSRKEPGWVRQRVDHAVAKAEAALEARLRAEFEARMAPLQESLYARQADELVAAGEFKSKERALEYVKLKNGVVDAPKAAPEAKPATAPSQEGNPAVKERANLLAAQADKVNAKYGIDVVRTIQEKPEMRQKVLSGEWDFYDVADAIVGNRRMPSPVRTPNGVGASNLSITNMSDAQFKKLQENLAAGKIYDAR